MYDYVCIFTSKSHILPWIGAPVFQGPSNNITLWQSLALPGAPGMYALSCTSARHSTCGQNTKRRRLRNRLALYPRSPGRIRKKTDQILGDFINRHVPWKIDLTWTFKYIAATLWRCFHFRFPLGTFQKHQQKWGESPWIPENHRRPPCLVVFGSGFSPKSPNPQPPSPPSHPLIGLDLLLPFQWQSHAA